MKYYSDITKKLYDTEEALKEAEQTENLPSESINEVPIETVIDNKSTELANNTCLLSVAECNIETQKHIENVRKLLRLITDKLTQRGVDHDASKMVDPEVELFAKYTKILSSLTYDSEEYKNSLEGLKPALDHHYAVNRHHPEHFASGVNDMTLVDVVEMLCDWKASTLRTNDGNLLKSIEANAERFQIDGQLKQILLNTARYFDEQN